MSELECTHEIVSSVRRPHGDCACHRHLRGIRHCKLCAKHEAETIIGGAANPDSQCRPRKSATRCPISAKRFFGYFQ